MAFRVEFSPQAETDANAILEWLIERQAGAAGLRWFEKLNAAIVSLSEFPYRCQLAPENASVTFELHQLLYGRKPHIYRVLFTIESDVVYVLRIRGGRRRRLDEPH